MKLNGMFSLMGHRRLKNQMWRHVKTCEYMWIHGKYHEISIKQINHWFPVFAHPWTKKMCTQTVAKPCSCLGFGVDGASGMQLLNSRWCSCRCCGHDAGSWQCQSRIQWRPWWFTKSHQPLVLCILTRNQLTNQKKISAPLFTARSLHLAAWLKHPQNAVSQHRPAHQHMS